MLENKAIKSGTICEFLRAFAVSVCDVMIYYYFSVSSFVCQIPNKRKHSSPFNVDFHD